MIKAMKEAVPENAPVAGVYEHYKGNRYQVLGTARHSESEEWLVLYQALYKERGFWVRPLDLWLEPAMVEGAAQVRFTLVAPNSIELGKLTQPS